MDFKSDMVRCTEQFLVVHFTARQGTSIRHATVKVPWETLVLSASVTEAMDRAARRALIEHWSGVEIPDTPLF